jgi:hypothetical protein
VCPSLVTLCLRRPARGACRLFLWCFSVLLISGIGLRVEAAIYGRQIISAVSALSTLRVGEPSEAETLSQLPMLRTSATGPYRDSPCNADECFFILVGNGLPGRILWGTRNSTLAALLRWWGFTSRTNYADFHVSNHSYGCSRWQWRLSGQANHSHVQTVLALLLPDHMHSLFVLSEGIRGQYNHVRVCPRRHVSRGWLL